MAEPDDLDGPGVDRGVFILGNRGRLCSSYQLDNGSLGEGTYGTVCKAYSKHADTVRAVKTIKKTDISDPARFNDEITLMKGLDHPNIIRLHETFEDKFCIYLVMELCTGGELFDRIIAEERFSESSASILMRQMLSAVWCLHSQCIMHRDLKPENFLFLNDQPDSPLKIIDFGLAKKFDGSGPTVGTKAGTPYYVAPEVMDGEYNYMCDIWSLGVIMYVLLCGYPPFAGETDQMILRAVKKGAYSFSTDEWRGVSRDAKVLITNMLRLHPEERYTAEQALHHPWIKLNAAKTSLGPVMKAQDHRKIVDQFRIFRNTSRMKKIALTIIATQLNSEEVKALRGTFEALDENGDGTLTYEEMRAAMYEHKIELPDDLDRVIKSIDSDRSGKIDYTEFVAATMDKRSYIQEDACWSAFRLFDADGNGVITLDELRQILTGQSENVEKMQKVCGPDLLRDMISEVDTNGDGMIDFEEFLAMMRGKENKRGAL